MDLDDQMELAIKLYTPEMIMGSLVLRAKFKRDFFPYTFDTGTGFSTMLKNIGLLGTLDMIQLSATTEGIAELIFRDFNECKVRTKTKK